MSRYDHIRAEREGLIRARFSGGPFTADQARALRRVSRRLERYCRSQRDRVMRQRRGKLERLGSAWVRWKPDPSKDAIEPAWGRA